MCVFYFVVLLCKGSAFLLGGQKTDWFLLVLLRLSAVSTGVLAWFSCCLWQFGTQKRHDWVMLHACGRRGVAYTLSTRKGTHFFADMQEKSHFSAILFRERVPGGICWPLNYTEVNGDENYILPLITLIYTDIPSIRVHLCWSVGHYCPLITLICTDILGIRVNPCASVGHYISYALRARNLNYLNLFP